jgi:thiol peroxidase
MERKVTFQGKALTLIGRQLKLNNPAPNFKVSASDLNDKNLIDYKDKIKIITSFPSLDTPVCDLQVKEFNKRASGYGEEVVILGISKDLPFAQKRFCDANDIKNVEVLSDYKYSSFGVNYGLLVKELNLLARSVLIVDKNDVLRYIQVVDEITNQPGYEDALAQLQEVLKNPHLSSKEEFPSHCKPCEAGTPPLSKETIDKLLAQHRGWELIEGKKLRKEFKFKDFVEAKYFVDLISLIAQEQGHHPTITITYNKVRLTLTTHAASGLTENDFIMARIIDELGV